MATKTVKPKTEKSKPKTLKGKKSKGTSKIKLFFCFILLLLIVGLLLPQDFVMPVKGADKKSYNKQSFWYFPWGKSGTHKGVDIFARKGSEVVSSTNGVIIYSGQIERGGNVVLILGPKWRLHYYAHLKEMEANRLSYVSKGEKIGSVGTTGNAEGKAPHLHYSICTLLPYPWNYDSEKQGWKKMFYLNPIEFLEKE